MAEDSDKSGLARRMQLRQASQNLEKAQSQTKKQQKDYAETVINYLRDNGQIICVTEDMPLTKLIKDIVGETLKMPLSCASFSSQADMTGKSVRAAVEAGRSPLVIIEQFLRGRDLSFYIKSLKNTFPEIKVIMIAPEIDKNRFVLLHESGVDSMLVRPLDSAAIMEKIALTIKPNDQAERSLEMARVLLGKGEHLQALQICSQEMARSGNSSAALMLTGDIFKAMREWDKAADAYSRASGASALYIEPLRKLADLYAEKGDMARQLEYLEKMDELSPLNLDRKIHIGELALKLKKGDKARKIFDQVMKLSTRKARESVASVAYRVADLYTDTDPDMAASFLQRGLDARKEFWSHEDISTFNKLGLLLRRSGKWREAADAYLKALTVAPNDETLHYNLAMAYLEGKEIESARASALKALGINPDLPQKSSRVAANLAAVFMGSNDKIHAAPLLRVALELDPQNSEALELQERLEDKGAQN